MSLSKNLVEFSGRVLPMEQVVMGGNQLYPTGDKVDWTTHLRSNPMFIMGELKDWVIMFPQRAGNDIETFVNQLIKVAQGMRFHVTRPK